MVNYIYPTEDDFRLFVKILQEGEYTINKYLPAISEDWFKSVSECTEYVRQTSSYTQHTFHEECARILYKVTKKHELADSNKRSALMSVILFCLVNDYRVENPDELKRQAQRIARTKGRNNEDVVRARVAECLADFILPSQK